MTSTNPALHDVAFLVGNWWIELSNAAFLPKSDETTRFQVAYEWKADGAVIAVQQGNLDATPPQVATWIIGRDEASADYTVLYADSRGVSRVYQMSFRNSVWRMWRDNPEFPQRFMGTVSKDRKKIDAGWEKSSDGGRTWEHDFTMTFERS